MMMMMQMLGHCVKVTWWINNGPKNCGLDILLGMLRLINIDYVGKEIRSTKCHIFSLPLFNGHKRYNSEHKHFRIKPAYPSQSKL